MKVENVKAVWTNRFITFVGDKARFVFADQIQKDGPIEYHTAVIMSREDAKAHAEMTLKLIAEVEAKEKADQPAAE